MSNIADESIIPNNIKITIVANKFHAKKNSQRQQDQRNDQRNDQRQNPTRQNYFGGGVGPSQEIISFKSTNKFPKFSAGQDIVFIDPLVKLTDNAIKSTGQYKELQFLIPDKFYELNNKLNKQTSDDIFYYDKDKDGHKIILNGLQIIVPNDSLFSFQSPIVFEYDKYDAADNVTKYDLISSLNTSKKTRTTDIDKLIKNIELRQQNNDAEIGAAATPDKKAALEKTRDALDKELSETTYKKTIIEANEATLSTDGKTLTINGVKFTKETDRQLLINASDNKASQSQNSQVTNNIKLTAENLFEYKSKFFLGSSPYSIYKMTLDPKGWQYNVLNYNLVKDEINLFRVFKPKPNMYDNLYKRIQHELEKHYETDVKAKDEYVAEYKRYTDKNETNYSVCLNNIVGKIDNEVKQFIRTGLNMSEIPSSDILIKYQEFLTKTYEYEKQMDKKNIPYPVRYQKPDDKFFIQSGKWDREAYDKAAAKVATVAAATVAKVLGTGATVATAATGTTFGTSGTSGTSGPGSLSPGSTTTTTDAAKIAKLNKEIEEIENNIITYYTPTSVSGQENNHFLKSLSIIDDFLKKYTSDQINKLTLAKIDKDDKVYFDKLLEAVLYVLDNPKPSSFSSIAGKFNNPYKLINPTTNFNDYTIVSTLTGIKTFKSSSTFSPKFESAKICNTNRKILQTAYNKLEPGYIILIKILRDKQNELNVLEDNPDKTKWEIQKEYYTNLMLLNEQNTPENKTFLEDIQKKIEIENIETELKTLNADLSATKDTIEKYRIKQKIKSKEDDISKLSVGIQQLIGGNQRGDNQRGGNQRGGNQRGDNQIGGSHVVDLPPQLHLYFEQYKTLEETIINKYSTDLKSVFTRDLDDLKLYPSSIQNTFFDSILNSINNYNTNNPSNPFTLSKGVGPLYTIDNLYETLIEIFTTIDSKHASLEKKIYYRLYEKFIKEFDKYAQKDYSEVSQYVTNKSNESSIYKALLDEQLPMKLNTSFHWDPTNTVNNDIFVENSAKFYESLKRGEYYVDKYSQKPLINILKDPDSSLNLYISIIAMDNNTRYCNLPTLSDTKNYYMFLYLDNKNYTIFSNNHNKLNTLYKVLPQTTYSFTFFNTHIIEGKIPSLLLLLDLYVHCDKLVAIYPFNLLLNEFESPQTDYNFKQLIKKEAEKLKNYKPSAASASAYSQQNYGQSASINRTNFCYYVTIRLDLYEGDELPLMNCDMKQQNILTEFTDLTGYTIPSEIKILGQHIPTGVPGPIDENKWLDMLNTNKPDKNKPATPTMFNQVTNLFKQAGQLINPNAAATATAALATTNALTAARPAAARPAPARPAPARPKLKGGINTRKKHSPTTKKIIFTKFKMPHATRRHHNITHKHMN